MIHPLPLLMMLKYLVSSKPSTRHLVNFQVLCLFVSLLVAESIHAAEVLTQRTRRLLSNVLGFLT